MHCNDFFLLRRRLGGRILELSNRKIRRHVLLDERDGNCLGIESTHLHSFKIFMISIW